MQDRSKSDIESKGAHWARIIGQTHTSRLLRGASRLAADLDVDAATAAAILGAAVDADREAFNQMMREGRY